MFLWLFIENNKITEFKESGITVRAGICHDEYGVVLVSDVQILYMNNVYKKLTYFYCFTLSFLLQ